MEINEVLGEIAKSQEAVALGLQGIGEILQKLDNRFEKAEEDAEEESEADRKKREAEEEKENEAMMAREKEEFAKSIANMVMKQITEKKVAIDTSPEKSQNAIQGAEAPAPEEEEVEEDEDKKKKEEEEEYPEVEKGLRKQINELKKSLDNEMKNREAEIKKEVEIRLKNSGWTEVKSGAAKKVELGADETKIVKSEEKQSEDPIGDLAKNYSWGDLEKARRKAEYDAMTPEQRMLIS